MPCEAAGGSGVPQAAASVGTEEHGGIRKLGDTRNYRAPKRLSQTWFREPLGLVSPKGQRSSLLVAHSMVSRCREGCFSTVCITALRVPPFGGS